MINCSEKELLLYAVTDRHWLGEETLYDQVKKALDGGATFVQLREKKLDREDFLAEAKEIQKLCKEYGVPFVINDEVSIAKDIDADGVHVGQSDMEAMEQAIIAEKHGADYLGVGAVFTTGSKDDADDVSHETLKAICEAVSIPVIAIGGITKDNVAELAGSGICGVAVISAIFGQKDIQKATEELKFSVENMLDA